MGTEWPQDKGWHPAARVQLFAVGVIACILATMADRAQTEPEEAPVGETQAQRAERKERIAWAALPGLNERASGAGMRDRLPRRARRRCRGPAVLRGPAAPVVHAFTIFLQRRLTNYEPSCYLHGKRHSRDGCGPGQRETVPGSLEAVIQGPPSPGG